MIIYSLLTFIKPIDHDLYTFYMIYCNAFLVSFYISWIPTTFLHSFILDYKY